jgi:maltodextrin utilization protein YvdJ
VQDKFKTLLAVETNAVKELNARMKILDKDVSDVLKSNKSFFNEEKAAADLKASQKEERALINKKISEAQDRIAILKADYQKDTEIITARIDKLRIGVVDDKSDVTEQIKQAEANILNAQNNIDDLVVEREPLEAKMIKLEAEVGPVKYIAALVVDWGVANEVDTSEAVRWVILIIIFVFDPLAVLLLVAANQSLIRKFPVEAPKPPEIVDLEKPDDEDVTLKWNDVMSKKDAASRMEEATEQLREWKEKLDAFNTKVPKPEDKPIEIIQEKKTEDKEIVVDKEKQLEEFRQRELAEQKALEQYALKAKLEDGFDPAEVEGYEEFNSNYDNERLKPDLTEVIEPETKLEEPKEVIKNSKPLVLRTIKEELPPKPEVPSQATLTDEERKGLLNKFHQDNGKFEDISAEELKMERDQSNRAQYLADVSLTKEEAEKQGPITESRLAFFQDIIDDILRGDTTFENVPEENRKIIAQIMDPDIPNPEIITKGSALKPEGEDGIEKMTTEGLKEKFMIEPKTEERPMTDEELDALLEGFEEEPTSGKKRMIIRNGKRIFVPVAEKDQYVQNEEQSDTTLWNKTKELDIPEPEKNEIILTELPNTVEEVPEIAENISIEQTIPEHKFAKYKKRVTSEEEYHQRIEQRIDDLITKLENKEISLSDLSEEDRNVIIDILNQNE